jgi:hypothetical protein
MADWTVIERDYRAGSMGLREIAAFYAVPESSIRKRAASERWHRVAKHISDEELRAAGALRLVRRSRG